MRPRTREIPVASAKIAVDHARRRPRATGVSAGGVSAAFAIPESIGSRFGCSGTLPSPASAGLFTLMPNIKQQKKRVRSAARERLEKLHYRSTVKTLTRRLRAAVDRWCRGEGRAPSDHRRPPQGAGRALALWQPFVTARLLSGGGRAALRRDCDQRALELEIDGEPRAALDRVVQRCERHDGVAQLVDGVVSGLRDELLDVERMSLEA